MEPKNTIMDWLAKNLWSLIIAFAVVISTYSLYGYRLDVLEQRIQSTENRLQVIDDTAVQTQISLARIEVDIAYIKQQLNRIFPSVSQ